MNDHLFDWLCRENLHVNLPQRIRSSIFDGDMKYVASMVLNNVSVCIRTYIG